MTETQTPMMRQYRRIRRDLPDDTILFFRLGDFYEMFFEDAAAAAPILGIALTKRNGIPMCGVPYHACDGYMAKLIKAGRKVAVCDQVEDASASRGIVRREVTRIITAGTVTEDDILEADRNNYIAGVCRFDNAAGLALLDLSTGLFMGETVADIEMLPNRLAAFAPAECVVPSEQADDGVLTAIMRRQTNIPVTPGEDWTFGYETARESLLRHFRVSSLDGFGCENDRPVVSAAGGILRYVRDDLKRNCDHIRSFRVLSSGSYMVMDESTCINLDLVSTRGGRKHPVLTDVLDVTRTPMGGRLLRDRVLRPLIDPADIVRRHDAVEALCRDRALMSELRGTLGRVRDIERLIARISSGSANARDARSLGHSLAAVPDIRELLADHPVPCLGDLGRSVVPLPDIVDLVERAIADEPAATLKEGGIIRRGYNAGLDDLLDAASRGRQWLAEYQERERKRTGIGNLKVRHNKVFGYYIEISKGRLGDVPADYSRRQTLVNAERFVTDELKQYETRVTGAQEKAMAMEYDLFMEIRASIAQQTGKIQATATVLAELDVLASLADRALALGYVRPVITDRDTIRIKNGRHALVERMPDAERFVPNDTLLDCSENQVIIITGPNMAGKSTYIRQVALIAIMAQIGSFVPADEAEIGVVDRVFTRIGASDELTRGRSTFMVEMQETANILNNATSRSLIVLDEIGRGTSTYDGISIAWAVAEYLHNRPESKAKTLFATHYHELSDMALTMKGVRNYNVLVREKGDGVVFLRRIVPGGCDKSYGIHVARLAGMPDEVIERSREILTNLTEGEFAESGQPRLARRRPDRRGNNPAQLQLFGNGGSSA